MRSVELSQANRRLAGQIRFLVKMIEATARCCELSARVAVKENAKGEVVIALILARPRSGDGDLPDREQKRIATVVRNG